MKNLTWQNPEQLFVAQELINKVKSKCCGIKDKIDSGSLSHANNGIYMRPHEKWDSSKSSSPGIIERRIKIANKFHELYLKKRHEYLNNHK